jgi:hypothetical protein
MSGDVALHAGDQVQKAVAGGIQILREGVGINAKGQGDGEKSSAQVEGKGFGADQREKLFMFHAPSLTGRVGQGRGKARFF